MNNKNQILNILQTCGQKWKGVYTFSFIDKSSLKPHDFLFLGFEIKNKYFKR